MRFATQINIADTIADMVDMYSMFTAYDVTKTLRHEGYHVRHSEVRDVVRDYDFPYEYREAVDSNIGALVHYYMNDDVADYDPNKVPEFVVNYGGGGPTAPSSGGSQGGNNGGASAPSTPSTKIVDKRSRFCVPASKLRNAGFMKGMHVRVLVDHDKIVIHNGTDGAEVTVDKSNNVRIAKGTLQNAFDAMPSTIKIDVSTNKVELSIDD